VLWVLAGDWSSCLHLGIGRRLVFMPAFGYWQATGLHACISLRIIKTMFGNAAAAAAAFSKILNFFLLKLNMVFMFWIVLMY
jgi:hypothetical protein